MFQDSYCMASWLIVNKYQPHNFQFKLNKRLANYQPAIMSYSRKKSKEGGGGIEDILFWHPFPPSGIFGFFTLPLKIPHKTRLYPWKLHKIVLHPLDKSDTMEVHGNLGIWIYIFESLICNFITIQHALLKYITIVARNP